MILKLLLFISIGPRIPKTSELHSEDEISFKLTRATLDYSEKIRKLIGLQATK